MTTINVVKSNGEVQPLDLEKVERTVLRAGASAKIASQISSEVARRAFQGISTREISKMVRKLLVRLAPAASRRYELRDAIIKLGPAGFDFEKYIADLLVTYGYKTELPPLLEGACITHEVDVLATKNGRVAMIEAKLRHQLGIFITIKDTTHTWTRFLDINDAAVRGTSLHLDECWIITNSRFSHDSVKFGACKGMTLIGWDHPKERPLPRWIDEIGLYPVTILKSINSRILSALSAANMMLLRDLVDVSPNELRAQLKLPVKIIQRLVGEAKLVLET